MMSNYAWIGLGNMGGPMTANLVAAGHTVKGFDLNEQACAAAAEGGVQIAGSIAEAMDSVDAVFTMLPKGQHVRSVYEGDAGIWAHATKQMLLIDSSTVDIETSRYIHEGSAQRGTRRYPAGSPEQRPAPWPSCSAERRSSWRAPPSTSPR